MKEQYIMNYKSKALDSFKTKLNLFIYQLVINNKLKFESKEFQSFEITEELVSEYSTVYWQQELEFIIKDKTIKEIYEAITNALKENEEVIKACREHYVAKVFPVKFPESKFNEMIKNEQCHYCELKKTEIETLSNNRQLNKKNLRGWNLEIDRLNSNFEYTPENSVMCCYWCNNAKTDEFTEEEFKRIGQSIKTVWKERIKRALQIREQERYNADVRDIKVFKNEQ